MIEDARQVWQEKLAFFLTEEAKCADPAQKFKIRQEIKEAQAKLEELSLPKPPYAPT
jgi:hypothetical protein